MNIEIRELTIHDLSMIKKFYADIFTKEPWNDDWSDDEQLTYYISDLIGNKNSLTFGMYENNNLVGLAMGCIKHWYSGTEYYIEEFCISTNLQGRDFGSSFMSTIESKLKDKNIKNIFLQTDRFMPAYEFYKKRDFSELCDHVSFIKKI